MSTLSNNDIACACCLVLKDQTPAEQPLALRKIVQFLARRRLLSRSGGALSSLDRIINKEENRVVAKVKSAQKFDEKTKMQLVQFLKKRYSAREVMLEEIIDEKLLGGFRIEANDEVIDLSFRNKIKKLEEYLTKSA